jgi:hypothetical protein
MELLKVRCTGCRQTFEFDFDPWADDGCDLRAAMEIRLLQHWFYLEDPRDEE